MNDKITGFSSADASDVTLRSRSVADFKEQALKTAIAAGTFDDDNPLAAIVDIHGVRETIQSLFDSFPDHFLHAFAAKANTMSPALALVRHCGMGCEVASPGELEQALNAGFSAEEIVYDAPAKSGALLRRVLDLGCGLNIDNFQEFERVRALYASAAKRSRVGFRINPQVGIGSISAMSTAGSSSKFGVALEDDGVREQLIACYRDNDWLSSLHTHVGSQGCRLEMMAEGIRKVFDLAEEINSVTGRRQVRLIDIGGGLPVNFDTDEIKPTFAEYAAVLRRHVPGLFSGAYSVKTEFGRSIFAKNGFIFSRVEYTKRSGGRRIALTHAGVQVATRTVFMPDHWPLRVTVHDATGSIRNGKTVSQDIAGPCCFAGDMIATERPLPLIEPGDYVVLHDTGAYYFSNPFYYNSLQAIPVYAAEWHAGEGVRLDRWRAQQSVTDMLSMLG